MSDVLEPATSEVAWAVVSPLFILLPLALGLVAWRDMNRQGRTGWAYGAAVALALPVGLLLWYVARREPRPAPASA